MKISDAFDISKLTDYGFAKTIRGENIDIEYPFTEFDYQYNIGHARRGQCYYILINAQTRVVFIYASEPDGSGGVIQLPDLLVTMINDGVLVKENQEN